MTTKPPPSVIPAVGDSVESIAYAAVADIPMQDPHDRDRLGYNLWRWLVHRKDPLELAIRSSGSRFGIPEEEALRRIREALVRSGIPDVD